MSVAELATFYVTFGGREVHGDHPVFPLAHPDGYLRVDAPEEATARLFLGMWLGGRYSNIYTEGSEGDPRTYMLRDAAGQVVRPGYPRGQLAHVEVRPEEGSRALRVRIVETATSDPHP